jgi:hypothetical protein
MKYMPGQVFSVPMHHRPGPAGRQFALITCPEMLKRVTDGALSNTGISMYSLSAAGLG